MTDPASPATVSLVLIVMNEEIGVEAVVPTIDRSVFDDCFAVDGHSKDNTRALLEGSDIKVHDQDEKGLGAAMMMARRVATTSHILFFHPDGNESAADLPRMAQELRDGKEFVVASRMIKGAINEDDHLVFKWRKWANQAFAVLANILFAHGGNRTSDVTNGFRGIACETWDRMQLTSKDLTMDYQMVIRALKLGIPITEFATHEGTRVAGATNFASFATGKAELALVWREWRMGRRKV
ncbi:MAG: glycosyltransferase involved in cell wall biosynthesis [Candidatus Promineifilaceae bacterium]|jgi:glycosyltransferase involved in cell wall biosynthesis